MKSAKIKKWIYENLIAIIILIFICIWILKTPCMKISTIGSSFKSPAFFLDSYKNKKKRRN